MEFSYDQYNRNGIGMSNKWRSIDEILTSHRRIFPSFDGKLHAVLCACPAEGGRRCEIWGLAHADERHGVRYFKKRRMSRSFQAV